MRITPTAESDVACSAEPFEALEAELSAPHITETSRLILRRPGPEDAGEIFRAYASDAAVTRYLSWPTHSSIEDTERFIEFSELEWMRWGAGPYLIVLRESGSIIGGTGLAMETLQRASTGYVLAKSAWGRGYASESLRAIQGVASALGVVRLYALCHTTHHASARVLEKCGFAKEGILRRYCEFPNLDRGTPLDVFCYSIILTSL
jgi:[ribosomal protein S5]-alanine N-acetyltransferase